MTTGRCKQPGGKAKARAKLKTLIKDKDAYPEHTELESTVWLIPDYDRITQIRQMAAKLGVKGTLASEEKPNIDGLDDHDWEGITAFDDLVKGGLFNGVMTYPEYQDWMKEKKQKREQAGHYFFSIADCYIDLCLQYLALKHSGRQLSTNWDYFINSDGNSYIHVQQYYKDNPGVSFSTFFEHSPFHTSRILQEIFDAYEREEDLAKLEELLKDATQLTGEGFPGYLFVPDVVLDETSDDK